MDKKDNNEFYRNEIIKLLKQIESTNVLIKILAVVKTHLKLLKADK
jgi:hypothetical protein